MISVKNIGRHPTGSPLVSDDVVEYHAARLLLLLRHCGVKDQGAMEYRIDGLTKVAKLDFFVRYPEFFKRAAAAEGKAVETDLSPAESRMIRYHYGPWDQRYYQVIPYLEARGLVAVRKMVGNNQYRFYLTEAGTVAANVLSDKREFSDMANKMRTIKKVLGHKSGNQLKKMIYSLFEAEVSDLSLGETIG